MPLPLVIFVNYRRDDRPKLVMKIRDGFVLRYGKDNVFMDLDIPKYTDFAQHLEEKVGVSSVLVACIGPEWLRLLRERDESIEPDYLIEEIKQALAQQHTMVATICVDDADFPHKDDIPPEIHDMLKFQISSYKFADDFLTEIGEVMDDIEKEYTRRGLRLGRVEELESILRLPYEEIEDYVFSLLETRNVLRIEKHLRDFPSLLLDSVNGPDATRNDDIKMLFARMSVFGVVFVKYEEYVLYRKYLRSQQRLLEDSHRRLSDNRQHPGKKQLQFKCFETCMFSVLR